jgi:alpha-beta hydrolase superfamily lysophospholipase
MEIKETSLTLKTGEKLFAWYMSPSSTPKAVVCLSHGWGEHSMRYKHWAEKFVDSGYAFFAWDHIGHGKSDGQRGHVKNYKVFLESIDLALISIGQTFPGIPIVLYGHSMGGNIAINFAIRRTNPFNLLVATSPWLQLYEPTPAALKIAVKILNVVWPSLGLSTPLKAEKISHIQEVVDGYVTDPLNHIKITPRLYTEIVNAGEYAVKNAHAINKPMLLLHGDADRVTMFDKSAELASKAPNCSFIPWKDMYHELHNETVQDEVFNMIIEWISGNLED